MARSMKAVKAKKAMKAMKAMKVKAKKAKARKAMKAMAAAPPPPTTRDTYIRIQRISDNLGMGPGGCMWTRPWNSQSVPQQQHWAGHY
jgi:hypothetical protein